MCSSDLLDVVPGAAAADEVVAIEGHDVVFTAGAEDHVAHVRVRRSVERRTPGRDDQRHGPAEAGAGIQRVQSVRGRRCELACGRIRVGARQRRRREGDAGKQEGRGGQRLPMSSEASS